MARARDARRADGAACRAEATAPPVRRAPGGAPPSRRPEMSQTVPRKELVP
ncbi:hypothetical protein GCM10012285_60720 [Streptomyces kronopolitis]|uniref:Uncharacterized protein n=1 Tax=Streptomyces kronopolitis TaxID=1612435 RepID=A0ABQ2K0Q6_9ACTN|nr:hypothetical protein [Streptomyces kronopolitis]GGN61584.1 hypothetical protein GCM10012285_60720 [Streptomyces kronopolitis]